MIDNFQFSEREREVTDHLLLGMIGYELFRYQTVGLSGENESFTQNTLRAGFSWQVNRWYYNLTVEHYFGDSADAYALNAYVEFRF